MQLTLLKCKIHRARVTFCDLDYEGSIAIDAALMEQAGILPFEQVDIYNVTNGERLTTYALEAPRGSKTFGINGAAARKAMKGDTIIVCAYAGMSAEEAKGYKPTILLMDESNNVQK